MSDCVWWSYPEVERVDARQASALRSTVQKLMLEIVGDDRDNPAANLVLILGTGAPLMARPVRGESGEIDCQLVERARCARMWKEIADRASESNPHIGTYVEGLIAKDLSEREHPRSEGHLPGPLDDYPHAVAPLADFQVALAELSFTLIRELARDSFLEPSSRRSMESLKLPPDVLRQAPATGSRSITHLFADLLKSAADLERALYPPTEDGHTIPQPAAHFARSFNPTGIRILLLRLLAEVVGREVTGLERDLWGPSGLDGEVWGEYANLVRCADDLCGLDLDGRVVMADRQLGIRVGHVDWLEALLRHTVVSCSWALRDESEMAFAVALPREVLMKEQSDTGCHKYKPSVESPLSSPRFYVTGSDWASESIDSSAFLDPIEAVVGAMRSRPPLHIKGYPHRFLTGLAHLMWVQSLHAHEAALNKHVYILTTCLDDEIERSLARVCEGVFSVVYPVREIGSDARTWIIADCAGSRDPDTKQAARDGHYDVVARRRFNALGDLAQPGLAGPEWVHSTVAGPVVVKLAGAPYMESELPATRLKDLISQDNEMKARPRYVHDVVLDEHDLLMRFIKGGAVPHDVELEIGTMDKYIFGVRTDVYGRVTLHANLDTANEQKEEDGVGVAPATSSCTVESDDDSDRGPRPRGSMLLIGRVASTDKGPIKRAGVTHDEQAEIDHVIGWVSAYAQADLEQVQKWADRGCRAQIPTERVF